MSEARVEVRAEMTASVWKVVATAGQVVTKGENLLILESMKMEIPVEAPVAGTVVEVLVQPEAQVADGDVLVTIRP